MAIPSLEAAYAGAEEAMTRRAREDVLPEVRRGFIRGRGRDVGQLRSMQADVFRLLSEQQSQLGLQFAGLQREERMIGEGREWQTGERIGGQQWQTGERMGGQQWQGGQSALDRAQQQWMMQQQIEAMPKQDIWGGIGGIIGGIVNPMAGISGILGGQGGGFFGQQPQQVNPYGGYGTQPYYPR